MAKIRSVEGGEGMAMLNDDIRYMKGVGEARAKAFAKLGVATLRDLISCFPRTYEDRSTTLPIAEAPDGEKVCIRAMVAAEPTLSRVRKGMELVKLRAVDDSGSVNITYFNQSYIRRQLKPGETYIFYGKMEYAGSRRSMTNPVYELCDGAHSVTGRIVPVYNLTAGISNKIMIASIRRGLDECSEPLPDYLPQGVADERQLCQSAFAYENIHFPKDFISLDIARRRMVFEELFVLACALTRIKNGRAARKGVRLKIPDLNEFYAALPFSPTAAQRRAIDEAMRDMASGVGMNRLVQGDVGSGKTLVAAACIWCAAKNGLQSAMMAPTEILASQHYDTLDRLLSPHGIRLVRLVGSMKAAEKRQVCALLLSGEAQVAVGTHALISEGVEYNDLSLVITDEQHRFGVNQRASLISKGSCPHILVMSATPIPRTLALMIYGDLDVSVIDELPPGRQTVDTFAVDESYRERLNGFIRKQVGMGHQVFIVCPAIDENEENPQDLKNATDYYEALSGEVFPELRIGCIHGRMKAAEKDRVMAAVVAGEIDVLVSTTVIEVGVDVPNATLMVVENAERFGLSQLHQLRGRVGRGAAKSYCILVSDEKYAEAWARLKILEKENDGFKISEEDLRLRGPGDFFGQRQHGLPEMHVADLGTDVRVLKDAQEAASRVLEADPELRMPENAALKSRVEELFSAADATMN